MLRNNYVIISARAKRSCFYVWKIESEIETESESDFFFNV